MCLHTHVSVRFYLCTFVPMCKCTCAHTCVYTHTHVCALCMHFTLTFNLQSKRFNIKKTCLFGSSRSLLKCIHRFEIQHIYPFHLHWPEGCVHLSLIIVLPFFWSVNSFLFSYPVDRLWKCRLCFFSVFIYARHLGSFYAVTMFQIV